ncbi:MAG: outer membrane beta-barrel family protein [Balneolales bacterium]
MLIKTFSLVFAFFLCGWASSSVLGQNAGEQFQLSGIVEDIEGNAISFATISIYDESETDLLTGTTTNDEGNFSINVSTGSYVLKVSYISYADYSQPIEVDDSMVLETITLQTKQAEFEVIVEGERSYMEMNFDSRSFNVGDDITSLGGSALDVLDHVPSITTDFEGNVSLRGNQGVQILINGRPSNLVRSGTDALSSLPSSMIKEVEVITNPSARYSADGTAGIINIILVDDVRLGFNGNIQVNTGYPQDHGIGANLNYHVNNINWFFNTDFEYESGPEVGSTFQSFHADTTYAFDENTDIKERNLEGSFYFGADMYLPNDQILTASSRISLEGGGEDSDVLYTDYNPGVPGVYRNAQDDWEIIQQTNRHDNRDMRENDFDLRLQYEKQFDGRDHLLTADADFEFGIENEESSLIEITLDEAGQTGNQRMFSNESYQEARLDVDYERTLGENNKVEAGYRSTFDWMDNNYNVEEFQDGAWVVPDEAVGMTDNFTYFENVNALYSMVSGKGGPFTYQLGLRTENTRIQTELDETGQGSNQNYVNLFPSVFVSYTLNEKNSFQLSYSRRISRPRSYMLLPFTEISDSRSRRIGNPELSPEFGNSFELGYLRYWETGSILSSVYYRHRTQVIERVSTIDGRGVTTTQPINLATEDAWGIEFSADQDLFKDMQLSGSLNIYQSNRDGVFEGVEYISTSESLTSRIRMRYRFLESWNFQSYLYYRGPRNTTQGRRGGSMFVGAALAKELFNRRANVSLNIRDLFNTRHSDREVINPESYTQSEFSWSSRSFRVVFRYNF